MSHKSKSEAYVEDKMMKAIDSCGSEGASLDDIQRYFTSTLMNNAPDVKIIQSCLNNAVSKGILFEMDNGKYKMNSKKRGETATVDGKFDDKVPPKLHQADNETKAIEKSPKEYGQEIKYATHKYPKEADQNSDSDSVKMGTSEAKKDPNIPLQKDSDKVSSKQHQEDNEAKAAEKRPKEYSQEIKFSTHKYPKDAHQNSDSDTVKKDASEAKKDSNIPLQKDDNKVSSKQHQEDSETKAAEKSPKEYSQEIKYSTHKYPKDAHQRSDSDTVKMDTSEAKKDPNIALQKDDKVSSKQHQEDKETKATEKRPKEYIQEIKYSTHKYPKDTHQNPDSDTVKMDSSVVEKDSKIPFQKDHDKVKSKLQDEDKKTKTAARRPKEYTQEIKKSTQKHPKDARQNSDSDTVKVDSSVVEKDSKIPLQKDHDKVKSKLHDEDNKTKTAARHSKENIQEIKNSTQETPKGTHQNSDSDTVKMGSLATEKDSNVPFQKNDDKVSPKLPHDDKEKKIVSENRPEEYTQEKKDSIQEAPKDVKQKSDSNTRKISSPIAGKDANIPLQHDADKVTSKRHGEDDKTKTASGHAKENVQEIESSTDKTPQDAKENSESDIRKLGSSVMKKNTNIPHRHDEYKFTSKPFREDGKTKTAARHTKQNVQGTTCTVYKTLQDTNQRPHFDKKKLSSSIIEADAGPLTDAKFRESIENIKEGLAKTEAGHEKENVQKVGRSLVETPQGAYQTFDSDKKKISTSVIEADAGPLTDAKFRENIEEIKKGLKKDE